MASQKRILIIDSQEGARRMETLLASSGYAFKTTASKADADTALNTWKPDLIVVNIFHMAFDTCEYIWALRKVPGAQNIKILVVSELEDIDLVTGSNPVVAGYLPKPVDFEQLSGLIKKHCKKNSPADKPTVIIADDDCKTSDLIRRLLEIENYNPIHTSTIAETTAALETAQPAAMIVAPLLADASGMELIRSIKSQDAYKELPIIVVSGLKLGEPQERGYLTGHMEYVAKQIPDSFILSAVAKLLAQDEKTQSVSEAEKPRVLLADDQTILLSLMKAMLETAGFKVATAEDGAEALQLAYKFNPDILVLDYALPLKTGFDIALELKENPLFAHIPIVILTAVGDKQLKLKGLSLGIDDYMIKPVDTDELVARIRMILKRTKQVLDANPLTRLPGNPSIQAALEKKMIRHEKFAVLYLDLNHFKAFNDVYGFEAGDKIIRSTADLVVNRIRKSESSEGFIGHIGGDDFIAISSIEKAEEIAKNIIRDFDAIAPSFYNVEDRYRGYIVTEDRQGVTQHFPLISISIGIVHNKERELTSFTQISEIGTELKHHAKQNGGSCYVMDRRKRLV